MTTSHELLTASLLLVCTALLASAFGQPADSPRNQVVTRFEEKAPKPGEALPALDLVDARGNLVPADRFRGRYTVLVLGCLT